MCSEGDTFRSADPAFESHLWVVISDPVGHPCDPVLVVSLTSGRPDKDDACVLDAGEHPGITHKSCVSYRRSRLVKQATLEAAFRQGHLRRDEPVSQSLLARIRRGVARTRFMPLEHLQLLRDEGLIG